METLSEIKLTKRKLKALKTDTVKSAEAINLVYVSDSAPGIRRLRSGKSFSYEFEGKPVTDEDLLFRIKRLVIPPAWENVWICPDVNGHLQVTGIDTRGRKQYKYHPLWNSLRNHTKYYHLHDFGKILPTVRSRLQKDISKQGLPQEKVLATIVSLMQCTCIRIGNSMYEKLYGSFGLTTLKDKHVTIMGNELKFSFKGKKGIYHDIKLKSKKLAKIVQQCRDIPGKELFQYYDDSGHRKAIDSGMVNSYIKEISSGNFTAKDFRTWAGTLHALQAFKEIGSANTVTDTKKNIVTALDFVAKQLGNTRTVCKKYYVHPLVIDLYTSKSLDKFFNKPITSTCDVPEGLTDEEKVLMKILEQSGSAMIAAA